MFSAVSRSISSAFFSATASWLAPPRRSRNSLPPRPSGGPACRRDASAPSCSSPRRQPAPSPCAAARGGGPAGVGAAAAAASRPPLRVAQVELAGSQPSRSRTPSRRHAVQLLAPLAPPPIAAQLDSASAPPRGGGCPRTAARSRSRPPTSADGVREERQRALLELARRDGVQHDHAERAPERAGIGTATIDWKRSSSSSGTYFMRGSASACSRMNSGRCRCAPPSRRAPRRARTRPGRRGARTRARPRAGAAGRRRAGRRSRRGSRSPRLRRSTIAREHRGRGRARTRAPDDRVERARPRAGAAAAVGRQYSCR